MTGKVSLFIQNVTIVKYKWFYVRLDYYKNYVFHIYSYVFLISLATLVKIKKRNNISFHITVKLTMQSQGSKTIQNDF